MDIGMAYSFAHKFSAPMLTALVQRKHTVVMLLVKLLNLAG